MTICNFIKINEKILKCINCGIVLEINDDIYEDPIFPCFGALRDPIITSSSDIQKIKNEALEVKPEHIEVESMCSDEQILQRYSICGTCEFFTNNTCSKCGCLLSRNKVYMSKLTWKQESCPIDKWSKIDD